MSQLTSITSATSIRPVSMLARRSIKHCASLAPDAEIIFVRLAVNQDQITEWDLPTRPTKTSDTRAKKFGSDLSVELDAIDPNTLRLIVEAAIEIHLPADQFAVLKAAEDSEREIISRLVGGLRTRKGRAK